MDVTQNLEAMDDDFEVLEYVFTSKVSTARTNVNASENLSIKNKIKLGSNTKNSLNTLMMKMLMVVILKGLNQKFDFILKGLVR